MSLLICGEDAWFEAPAREPRRRAEVLAVINASPFHVGKGGERERP